MPLSIADEDKKFEGFDLFAVKDAARTLTQAELIKGDKKLWAAASKYMALNIAAERAASKKGKT